MTICVCVTNTPNLLTFKNANYAQHFKITKKLHNNHTIQLKKMISYYSEKMNIIYFLLFVMFTMKKKEMKNIGRLYNKMHYTFYLKAIFH